MLTRKRPEIGNWYKGEVTESFEVVAYDEDDGTIGIQYYDGAVEELDEDSWFEMAAKPVEPPEDWNGSYDMDKEDYGVDLDSHSGNGGDWQSSVDSIE